MLPLTQLAPILVALFVLLSGIATLLPLAGQAGYGTQLGWATGIFGLLGGLAWLGGQFLAKEKKKA